MYIRVFFIDFETVEKGEYELIIINNKNKLIRWNETLKISFSDFSGSVQEKEYLSLSNDVESYYDKYKNLPGKVSEIYLVSNQTIKNTTIKYDENENAKLVENILTVDCLGVNKLYFKTINNKIIYTNFDLNIIYKGIFSDMEKIRFLHSYGNYYYPNPYFNIYYVTEDLPSQDFI